MEHSFIPTYPKLQSYDPYITGGDGSKRLVAKDGTVEDDTKAIEQDIDNYHWQVKKLAALLKADSKEQSAYNVWHFIKNNIAYKKDPLGEQDIRSPYNIWQERANGIDCKGMAIFAYSLLLEMGYNPDLVEAAFYGDPTFSHIFARLEGFVIDAVPTMEFNRYAPGITKRMRIYSLNGVPNEELTNIGAVQSPDATTVKLKALLATGKLNADEAGKVAYVISLDGSPERNILLHIMDSVKRINTNGTFTYNSGVDFKKLNAEIEEMEDQAGLGKIKLKIGKAIKSVEKKVAAEVKKVAPIVLKDVEKVGKALIKYNPATIIVRNATLAILGIDLFGFSKHLKLGYYTADEAKAHNLDPEEFTKLQGIVHEVEKLFSDMGGSLTALKNTIVKGGGGLSGPEIVAAAGPIAAIMAFLKKVDFSKLIAKSPPFLQKDLTEAETKLKSAISSGAAPKPSTAPIDVGQGVTNAQAAAASAPAVATSTNNSSTNNSGAASTDNSTTPAAAKSSLPGWVLPAAAVGAKLLFF